MKNSFDDPESNDTPFDVSLRPPAFSEFEGQDKVRERLELLVAAAKGRGDVLEHVLLSGPPGLGKTTLAHIVAQSMGVSIKNTSGPVIEKAGDLAGLLTTLERGDVLFIDEIHRLQATIEEYLYPAMEDYKLDIIIDQGPNARSVRLNLPKFTMIGATTRSGMISAPLRSRFGMDCRLDYYSAEHLANIVERSGDLMDVPIDAAGALEIARRARGTPRIANNLLRWVRDFAQVRAHGRIDRTTAQAALDMLEVDAHGFDELDRRLLRTIIEKYDGGPVGLNTLAAALGEEQDALEEVYEPFLMQIGFLNRTPRGRVATRLAYEHLGIAAPVKAAQYDRPTLF